MLIRIFSSGLRDFFIAELELSLSYTFGGGQLQRQFLWRGPKCSKMIAWISWIKVCKSKIEGGLWIRELQSMNLVFLGKWRWRLILGGVGL
jgi:hypothetical protein